MVEIIGWAGIIFTVVGLFVSSHTLAYYLGHKRGGGQWALANPFGQPPLKPRVDAQYLVDYDVMKNANSNLNREIVRLQLDKEGLQKEIKLLEAKVRAGDRRRAKRDETLTALYTTASTDEYLEKYEKSKALNTKAEMQDTVKKYARRKAQASDAKQ